MADIPDTEIDKRAAKPKSVFSDGTKVEQHSIPDQIAGEQYASAKRHARSGGLPFRTIGAILPGSH